MKISIRGPAQIYDKATGERVLDPSIIATLDGWRYEGDSLYNYLDDDLVDKGIVGGIIRASVTSEDRLEAVVDYWAPSGLLASDINALLGWPNGIASVCVV